MWEKCKTKSRQRCKDGCDINKILIKEQVKHSVQGKHTLSLTHVYTNHQVTHRLYKDGLDFPVKIFNTKNKNH